MTGMKRRSKSVLIAAAVLTILQTDSVWGNERQEQHDGEIQISRNLTIQEKEEFSAPPREYVDPDGRIYDLESWSLEQIPPRTITEDMEQQVIYSRVEGADELPWTIEAPSGEEVSRKGTLQFQEARILKESWEESLRIPVTFHAYGSRAYRLGDTVLETENQALPPAQEYQEALLGILGLSGEDYQIQSLSWSGEPYRDSQGQLCRDGEAAGKKRLRDWLVVYSGPVQTVLPESWRLDLTYRPRRPSQVRIPPTPDPEAEMVPQDESWIQWWIRRAAVLTLSLGLVCLLLGLILLAAQKKKKRKNKDGIIKL